MKRFKLTIFKNIGIQALAIGLQVASAQSGNLDGWQRIAAHAGIAAVQGAIAAAGHKTNPDGTPAEEPYKKPKRSKGK